MHASRAHVRFLATSTSVRGSHSGSEDVYLADVALDRQGNEEVLARVVDEYPPWQIAIPSAVLKSATGTQLRLMRDPECDVAYAQMPLRTALGDPIAILPVLLQFQPELPQPVQPEQILPCYRIVR